LKNLLPIAEKAANKALQIALSFLNDPGIIKNDFKDIKTIADLRMNECILEELELTQIPILSEESEFLSNKIPEECWIVDPLDGTYNFSRRYPCAGISIAYIKHGLPVLGVVKDIFNNITYSSLLEKGARKNEVEMEVSKTDDLKDAILATGFPSGASYETNNLLDFVRNIQEFKKIRAIGSASLMLSSVADGIFDVYYEKDIYLWDVAAGLSLVEEAGGQFMLRKTTGIFKCEVLASNKILFEKAKALLIK
jgi:myo-inositol-1(or 4)-monophosphatase